MRRALALMSTLVFALTIGAGTAAAQNKEVGADKCAKMCHKVQYTSWLETKHAKAEKKTECETCHGPGSGYMTMSIMKDPAKAKAAGLIAKPDIASCNRCHKPGEIKPDMLTKVHAHKG
ncbi:MAG: cytochrome c3 family protein [Acidobacteriota bacterium]